MYMFFNNSRVKLEFFVRISALKWLKNMEGIVCGYFEAECFCRKLLWADRCWLGRCGETV